MVEYETPINCMRRLTKGDKSEEFIFHLKFTKSNKNEVEIRTTLNKARVISKKINNIIEIDPTVNEYDLTILEGDLNEMTQIFSKILKSTEEKIELKKEDEKKIKYILFLLGETTDDNLHIEFKSIDESILYLKTSQHDHCIEFLSNRLQEMIDGGEFFELEKNIANEIIDSYFLQHEITKQNENEMRDEVIKIFDGMKEREDETVVMHFLLQIEYFNYNNEICEYINNHLSDDIVNNELGQIIRQYRYQLENIEQKQMKKMIEKTPSNSINIEFDGNELNGIISYMKKLKGDNLISQRELTISSGHSPYSGSVENLIKYETNHIIDYFRNTFGSNNYTEKDGWIEFDFQERKVNLTSYTVRTGNYYYPKTWRILGSNDGKNWEVINEQTNNSVINGSYSQHRFECNTNKNYYRYIRYIQDDSCASFRKYNICLSCIEFFGSISIQ